MLHKLVAWCNSSLIILHLLSSEFNTSVCISRFYAIMGSGLEKRSVVQCVQKMKCISCSRLLDLFMNVMSSVAFVA